MLVFVVDVVVVGGDVFVLMYVVVMFVVVMFVVVIFVVLMFVVVACVCAVVNPVLNWVSHSCVCSTYIRWW